MRILILGGTSFIGRAVTRRLLHDGDELLIFHRGRTEPAELGAAQHLHADRSALLEHREALARWRPDAVVDTYALTRRDAESAVAAVPASIPAVVLSSQDVYEAFSGFMSGSSVAAVPLREDAALRTRRFLYRGDPPPGVPADYEKIDVEAVWSARGAAILRLPMVYGPGDRQCREGFMLRRIAAGRRSMPFGTGNLLWSRAHVDDVAAAVAIALRTPAAQGSVINIADPSTASMELWSRQIADSAQSEIEFVRVPDRLLPSDLLLTGAHAQHVLADTRTAAEQLRWSPAQVEERIADSVRWHLEHRSFVPWTAEDTAADERAMSARFT